MTTLSTAEVTPEIVAREKRIRQYLNGMIQSAEQDRTNYLTRLGADRTNRTALEIHTLIQANYTLRTLSPIVDNCTHEGELFEWAKAWYEQVVAGLLDGSSTKETNSPIFNLTARYENKCETQWAMQIKRIIF